MNAENELSPWKTDQEQSIAKIVQLIANGTECYLEAGRMIVKLEEEHPEANLCDTLITRFRIPRRFIQALCSMGRGNMLPEAFQVPLLERLPIEDQRRVVSGPVDVLCVDGSTIKVDLLKADSSLRAQVVGPSGLRDLAQQRQYIEAKRTATPVKREVTSTPWVIRGRKLVVLGSEYGDVELSYAHLLDILKSMNG